MTPDRPLIVVAVVAMARNRVIGLDGAMPWSLPSDLKRYRALTMGKPMIMGRKTLQSIGRILDGRDTIVLSRGGRLPIEGAILAGSADEALAAATEAAVRRGSNEIVIAGGAEIYRQFLPLTDRISMTVVEAEPEGDTWFPDWKGEGFSKVFEEVRPPNAGDSAGCRFETWERGQAR